MILETVAIAISVISLVAVLYQSIGLKKTLESQIYESFLSTFLEIDRQLIDYPNVRKYLYYGVPVDENTPDLDRIMSVIELVADSIEQVDVYKNFIPKDKLNGWLNFVNDVTHTPAYEYYLKKHGKWFISK